MLKLVIATLLLAAIAAGPIEVHAAGAFANVFHCAIEGEFGNDILVEQAASQADGLAYKVVQTKDGKSTTLGQQDSGAFKDPFLFKVKVKGVSGVVSISGVDSSILIQAPSEDIGMADELKDYRGKRISVIEGKLQLNFRKGAKIQKLLCIQERVY